MRANGGNNTRYQLVGETGTVRYAVSNDGHHPIKQTYFESAAVLVMTFVSSWKGQGDSYVARGSCESTTMPVKSSVRYVFVHTMWHPGLR